MSSNQILIVIAIWMIVGLIIMFWRGYPLNKNDKGLRRFVGTLLTGLLAIIFGPFAWFVRPSN